MTDVQFQTHMNQMATLPQKNHHFYNIKQNATNTTKRLKDNT